MSTYRQVGPEVDARQWVGGFSPSDLGGEVIAWITEGDQSWSRNDRAGWDSRLVIHTGNKSWVLEPGDWVVKDSLGGFYGVPQQLFDQQYMEVLY